MVRYRLFGPLAISIFLGVAPCFATAQLAPANADVVAARQPFSLDPQKATRIKDIVRSLRRARLAPIKPGFPGWSSTAEPDPMVLPPAALALATSGGVGQDALGLFLRLQAEQAPDDATRIPLLELATVLGQPMAALTLSSLWAHGSPEKQIDRGYAMALVAAERGVVLGDIAAIDTSLINPAAYPMPQHSVVRSYAALPEKGMDNTDPAIGLITGLRTGTPTTIESAEGLGIDRSKLPNPSYELCGALKRGDTAAFEELGRRALQQDMVSEPCFVEALAFNANAMPLTDVASAPDPFYGLLVERALRGASSVSAEGEAAYLIGHWLARGSLGLAKPAEAAIWFLRAGQLMPDLQPLPDELAASGRYAEAIAALPKPVRTPVVAALEPLRAHIFPDIAVPAPDPARRSFVGLNVHKISMPLAQIVHLDPPNGVVIEGYAVGSAGRASGIEIGDIVISFGGKPTGDPSTFVAAVSAAEPDRDYPVELIRGGERMKLSVRPAALPKAGQAVVDGGGATPDPAKAATSEDTGRNIKASIELIAGITPTWRKATVPVKEWARSQGGDLLRDTVNAGAVSASAAGMMFYLSGWADTMGTRLPEAAIDFEAGYALGCVACAGNLADILTLDNARLPLEPELAADWYALGAELGSAGAAARLVDLPVKRTIHQVGEGGATREIGGRSPKDNFTAAYAGGDPRTLDTVDRGRAGDSGVRAALEKIGVALNDLPETTLAIAQRAQKPMSPIANQLDLNARQNDLKELISRARLGDGVAMMALGDGRFSEPEVAYDEETRGYLLRQAAVRGIPNAMGAYAAFLNDRGEHVTDAAIFAFCGWVSTTRRSQAEGQYAALLAKIMSELPNEKRKAFVIFFRKTAPAFDKKYR